MNVKVSIVVPVYNAGNFMRTTIDALIAQELKEVEIILINDGSKDNSGAICNEYSRKDSRIKVIHQQNRGPAAARNNGIVNAVGEYVAFCDADDLFEPEIYKELYAQAKQHDADICICGFKEVHISGAAGLKRVSGEYFVGTSKEEIGYGVFLTDLYNLMDPPWNKLFRRVHLLKNNMYFPSLDYSEDAAFNVNSFYGIRSLVIIDKPFYHYIIRNLSVVRMTNKYVKDYDVIIKTLHKARIDLYSFYEMKDPKYQDIILSKYINYCRSSIINLFHPNCDFTTRQKTEFIKNIFHDVYLRQNISRYKADFIDFNIFVLIVKLNSALLCKIIYKPLCWLRRKIRTGG